jgi:hypothetical protein
MGCRPQYGGLEGTATSRHVGNSCRLQQGGLRDVVFFCLKYPPLLVSCRILDKKEALSPQMEISRWPSGTCSIPTFSEGLVDFVSHNRDSDITTFVVMSGTRATHNRVDWGRKL